MMLPQEETNYLLIATQITLPIQGYLGVMGRADSTPLRLDGAPQS